MDKTCTLPQAESAADVRELTRRTLGALSRRIASGDLSGVHIPLAAPLFCDSVRGSHYHSRPELFLQVSGASRMRLTTGVISCAAPGLLLMPRGVAHHESADSTASPFCNLVFMHGAGHFSYHAGLPRGKAQGCIAPVRVGGSCNTTHGHGSRLYGYLNEAADFVAAGHPVRHPVVQGLLLTHLGLLQTLVEQTVRHTRSTESALVARCRRLVQEQLTDTRLSVRRLAGQLRCTPDYLSTRFRRDCGVRLTAHINHERCHLARHLLRTTPWSVKEVAVRCGYADAGYFSRIFTQQTGSSPREFRKAEVLLETGA
ncbi:MAG: helix-turn-helix transcriptional regulator [Lentisphaerae bacterium]|nr:helix-turn-helix transcriptional regulator [Lentisphaerota bacterium]